MVDIGKGKVVTFHYTVTSLEGDFIDTSKGRRPSSYMHGYGVIAPVLERELSGKQKGDQCTVVIPPAEGYGVFDDSEKAYTKVSKDELPDGIWFQKGIPISKKLEDGKEIIMYMHDYEDGVFVLTHNHPLAGVTMVYNIEIIGVRKALPMELKKCFIPCQILVNSPICVAS